MSNKLVNQRLQEFVARFAQVDLIRFKHVFKWGAGLVGELNGQVDKIQFGSVNFELLQFSVDFNTTALIKKSFENSSNWNI